MSFVLYVLNGVECLFENNRNEVEKHFFSLPDSAQILKLVLKG